METLKKKAYIFASIFALSNKLQVIGDKFDKELTVKQWLLKTPAIDTEDRVFRLRALHAVGAGEAALLLMLDNIGKSAERQSESVLKVYNEIEWITIFFFIGLFIVIAGVEHAGLLKLLADQLLAATGGDFAVTGYSILWASAVLSAIVDNIPFVATMIPLIKAMAPAFGGPDALMPHPAANTLAGPPPRRTRIRPSDSDATPQPSTDIVRSRNGTPSGVSPTAHASR